MKNIGPSGSEYLYEVTADSIKTLLYRGLMVAITVTIAFVVTGNTGDALQIGFVTNLVKTGTYYGYERLWARVSWGLAAD